MQRHEVIAEQLIAIGWKPSCDAQWSKLKTWLESYDQPKPATGEQPGSEWIEACVAELWTDIYHTQEEAKAIIAKHALAAPAPKEVSAANVLDVLTKGDGDQQYAAELFLKVESELKERVDKAKEPHA